MAGDPNRDVTTIDIDLKLSNLKPLHAKCMKKIYKHLLSSKGRKIIASGWRASGISKTVMDARMGLMPELDPFIYDLTFNLFRLH